MAPLTRLLAACVALGVTWTAQAHLRILDPLDRAEPVVTPTGITRSATLGFDALLADYRWLEAIQVVGREHADLIGSAPRVQALIEDVVALDPFVDHPYRFASFWLVNDAAQVRAANRILERGTAYHPLDWRDHFYLSFNQFFYLGDTAAAARELEPAVSLPGSPRYLTLLLASLRSDRDGLEAAAAYLQELLRQSDDPWKRADYEKALDEIETERRARVLDQARAVFRSRRGRDIARVEELAQGPDPVLRGLPPELHGWGWVIDPKSDRIQSAYYGHRYQVHLSEPDRKRQQAWAQGQGSAPAVVAP